MNWFTVKEKSLVWAPIGTITNKNGETKTRFIKLGVKVQMMDGTWWFYSFKHKTWTKHNLRVQRLDRLGRPMVEAGKPVYLPERKDNYTTLTLHREWMKRKPELVKALESSVEECLAE